MHPTFEPLGVGLPAPPMRSPAGRVSCARAFARASLVALVAACGSPVAAVVPPETTAPEPSQRAREAAPRAEATASATAPAPEAPAPEMSLDEAWAWLRAELPEETVSLRPSTDRALDALLAWAPPEGSITVYDRRCAPLRLARREEALVGHVHEKTETRGKTKTVTSEEIVFSRTITRTCSSSVTYERDARGRWQETGASAFGCADVVGFGLSEVTASQVHYGAGRVDVAVVRREGAPLVQHCLDGRTRACRRPGRLQLAVHARANHFGVGVAPAPPEVAPPPQDAVDCASPCPPVEETRFLASINAALAKGTFVWTVLDEHPVLFKTRAACQAYRKRHTLSSSQVDLW